MKKLHFTAFPPSSFRHGVREGYALCGAGSARRRPDGTYRRSNESTQPITDDKSSVTCAYCLRRMPRDPIIEVLER